MFTGIIEELGEVVAIDAVGDSARLSVRGPLVTGDAALGDSIAVNGVCLTVAGLDGDTFVADVMKESLDRSSLRALGPGSPVNLERAAPITGRLGGHIVQGHVDGTARIVRRTPAQHWELVQIELPRALSPYVVEKGSITVDGVSLTVAALDEEAFTVSLVPVTLERTTLGRAPVGALVNLEVDVIAKYVERLLDARFPRWDQPKVRPA